jgi:hypothetical protein
MCTIRDSSYALTLSKSSKSCFAFFPVHSVNCELFFLVQSYAFRIFNWCTVQCTELWFVSAVVAHAQIRLLLLLWNNVSVSAAVVSSFGYQNAPSFTVLSTNNVLSYNSVSAALLRNDPHVCFCDVSTELSFACYLYFLSCYLYLSYDIHVCLLHRALFTVSAVVSKSDVLFSAMVFVSACCCTLY